MKEWRPDLKITVADATPRGLVLITSLDSTNMILEDSYQKIVDEYRNMDLSVYALERLHREFNVVSTNELRDFQNLQTQGRDHLQQAAEPTEQLVRALQTEIAAIHASTSWRITAPLRAAKTAQHTFVTRFLSILHANRGVEPASLLSGDPQGNFNENERGVAASPETKHHRDAFLAVPFSYPVEPFWPLPRIMVMLHLYDDLDSLPRIKLGANARLSVSMQASRPCSAIFDAIPWRQNELLSRTSSRTNAARGAASLWQAPSVGRMGGRLIGGSKRSSV